MRLASKVVVVLVLAVGVTLASSGISRTVSATVPGIMGCEKSCQVAAAGWPLPYVIDYPGLSPVGSASLLGALLGLDNIRPASLLGNFAFWMSAFTTVVWLRGGATKSSAA